MAGLDVVIVNADPALTGRHLDRLRQEAAEFEKQGLIDPSLAELVRANLRAAENLPESWKRRIGSRRPCWSSPKSKAR